MTWLGLNHALDMECSCANLQTVALHEDESPQSILIAERTQMTDTQSCIVVSSSFDGLGRQMIGLIA